MPSGRRAQSSSICWRCNKQLAALTGSKRPNPDGVLIWRQVGTEEPQLAVVDPGIGLLQRRLAVPERLDLGALEDDAALEGLEDVVLVAGAPVGAT